MKIRTGFVSNSSSSSFMAVMESNGKVYVLPKSERTMRILELNYSGDNGMEDFDYIFLEKGPVFLGVSYNGELSGLVKVSAEGSDKVKIEILHGDELDMDTDDEEFDDEE